MRKASSPRLDVSLRTTEVIGLSALCPVQLAAQGLLGADYTNAEARAHVDAYSCSTTAWRANLSRAT
jgi:hypothetical protein